MRRAHREVWYLEYGMTRERLMELRAICRQYPFMKHNTRMGCAGKRAERYAKRVKAIEDSAGKIDRIIAPYIIGAVSKIHWDFNSMRPPCGERQFRRYIHLFYAMLDAELD